MNTIHETKNKQNWDNKKDFTQLNDKECIFVLNEEVARLRQKDNDKAKMFNDKDWNYFAK